ncbi:hypothetical protein DXA32_20010 [Subdoligranulum sp. OF01-18]|nr:hypothetical protein DXA32_20010 [Subdoligranulum sp. OF01-18]
MRVVLTNFGKQNIIQILGHILCVSRPTLITPLMRIAYLKTIGMEIITKPMCIHIIKIQMLQ